MARPTTRTALLAGLLVLLLAGVSVRAVVWPRYAFCDACDAMGTSSCGAPECLQGTVPCTGSCLKVDMPGWEHRDVPGSPPALLWMKFTDDGGDVHYVSQAYLGTAVVNRGGRWTLAGRCPTCKGSTRMLCPACRGKQVCPDCAGTGKIRKWF